jgi:glycopeptide antibiotics resistance protein
LRTIAAQAEYETWHERVRQLGGNVLVFAPLGVLLPLAAPRAARFGVVVAAGLLFSVGVELAQFAVSSMLGYAYRVADVDDVMLNVLGVALGYGLYRIVRSR